MAYIDLEKMVQEKGSILTTSYASEADYEQAKVALLKALTDEAEKRIIHVKQSERPSRTSG